MKFNLFIFLILIISLFTSQINTRKARKFIKSNTNNKNNVRDEVDEVPNTNLVKIFLKWVLNEIGGPYKLITDCSNSVKDWSTTTADNEEKKDSIAPAVKRLNSSFTRLNSYLDDDLDYVCVFKKQIKKCVKVPTQKKQAKLFYLGPKAQPHSNKPNQSTKQSTKQPGKPTKQHIQPVKASHPQQDFSIDWESCYEKEKININSIGSAIAAGSIIIKHTKVDGVNLKDNVSVRKFMKHKFFGKFRPAFEQLGAMREKFSRLFTLNPMMIVLQKFSECWLGNDIVKDDKKLQITIKAYVRRMKNLNTVQGYNLFRTNLICGWNNLRDGFNYLKLTKTMGSADVTKKYDHYGRFSGKLMLSSTDVQQ